MLVRFYDTADDHLLRFAVIISKSNGKWVFCKHRERDTYEVPGGHREKGEPIDMTAKRELREETDAVTFRIKPICVYSVTGVNPVDTAGEETFGMLYFADITAFENDLAYEIEQIVLLDTLPTRWTYPDIQPQLIAEYEKRMTATAF
ncbi:MAG: NUDIX domain-containing protein [Clostridia bacterium]|nr:NUDIX domain-containing protein [Clostridia bacterium]